MLIPVTIAALVLVALIIFTLKGHKNGDTRVERNVPPENIQAMNNFIEESLSRILSVDAGDVEIVAENARKIYGKSTLYFYKDGTWYEAQKDLPKKLEKN